MVCFEQRRLLESNTSLIHTLAKCKWLSSVLVQKNTSVILLSPRVSRTSGISSDRYLAYVESIMCNVCGCVLWWVVTGRGGDGEKGDGDGSGSDSGSCLSWGDQSVVSGTLD